MANVVVGVLDPDEEISTQKFLLHTAELASGNHSTIARLFMDAVRILGDDFDSERILLFISDAAPYMVKAAKAIQVFFPKITHVTCVAHALHRVCEAVRSEYDIVDRFVANCKKVFVKAPSRQQIFRELEPDIALPPQPITTRWGTWMDAVQYYADNIERIERVFAALDEDDAVAIKICNELLRDGQLKSQIIFIASNFAFLAAAIKNLESGGQSLQDQIGIIRNTQIKISDVPGTTGRRVREKLDAALKKNSGFDVLCNILARLVGEGPTESGQYTVAETLSFKYAPITSVDVERSFSMYKSVLRPNRESFLFENLSEMFVIYCNKNI